MKVSLNQIIRSGMLASLVLLLSPAHAHNKVVVIPMSGDDIKPLENIVTVAKQNGDFNDPVAAVNSITTASPTNPFLVVIAPGEYTITQSIMMKEWVSIAGSGVHATLIKGSLGDNASEPNSAIFNGADNVTLSDLKVSNTVATGDLAIGIYNNGASPILDNLIVDVTSNLLTFGIYNDHSSYTKMRNIRIEAYGNNPANNVRAIYNANDSDSDMTDIRAHASGGTYSHGIENYRASPIMTNILATSEFSSSTGAGITNDEAAPTMTNITALASDSPTVIGINNVNSSPIMTQIIATAKDSAGEARGISNWQSDPDMSNIKATADAMTEAYGLYNYDSSPSIVQLKAIGEDTSIGAAADTYGVFNNSSGSGSSGPNIRDSFIKGGTAGLTIDASSTRVVNSMIDGAVVDPHAGTTECRGLYSLSLSNVSC